MSQPRSPFQVTAVFCGYCNQVIAARDDSEAPAGASVCLECGQILPVGHVAPAPPPPPPPPDNDDLFQAAPMPPREWKLRSQGLTYNFHGLEALLNWAANRPAQTLWISADGDDWRDFPSFFAAVQAGLDGDAALAVAKTTRTETVTAVLAADAQGDANAPVPGEPVAPKTDDDFTTRMEASDATVALPAATPVASVSVATAVLPAAERMTSEEAPWLLPSPPVRRGLQTPAAIAAALAFSAAVVVGLLWVQGVW
jgi:hypothetical protein